jgi:hypothetical protein
VRLGTANAVLVLPLDSWRIFFHYCFALDFDSCEKIVDFRVGQRNVLNDLYVAVNHVQAGERFQAHDLGETTEGQGAELTDPSNTCEG